MNFFLSHSSKDKRLAEQISLALLNIGHDVFFDKDSLQPGDEFDEKIRSEILTCDRFIFLLSEHSIQEKSYSLSELKFIQERWSHPKQRVLTIVIDDTTIEKAPPYLTAATFLRPVGNISAEVAGFIAQLDEFEQKVVRTRFNAIKIISLLAVIAMGLITYFAMTVPDTPYDLARERLEKRIVDKPGSKAKIYQQFGFGFIYPAAWIIEDGSAPYGVPDIDIIQRYTDQKAAIGLELRLMPIQPNYIQDVKAEVNNQADVLRKIDPDLIVDDFTVDGIPAKRFRYIQGTGKRKGQITRIWVRLVPEVKLQIISFTYNDEPDKEDFHTEVRRIIDSIVIDKRLLFQIREKQRSF